MKEINLNQSSKVKEAKAWSNGSCNCGACNCNCGSGGTPTTKCADGDYISLNDQIKEIYST